MTPGLKLGVDTVSEIVASENKNHIFSIKAFEVDTLALERSDTDTKE